MLCSQKEKKSAVDLDSQQAGLTSVCEDRSIKGEQGLCNLHCDPASCNQDVR